MKQLLINSLFAPNGKSKSEHLILLAVAFLGLIGSSYMINNCKGNINSTSYESQNFTEIESLQIPIRHKKEVLKISGDLKEKSPIQFSLPEIISNQRFIIDFGNGEKRVIAQDNLYYSYNRPGNYKVKLLSMNNERMKMVDSRNVLISQKSNYN